MATRLTFAVPDLHGRLDLLERALEVLGGYGAKAPTIVFLGDYIDRGPDGAGVIERLLAGAADDAHWICLKGNHEAMMSLALRNQERVDWWIDNGGDTTIASYRERRDRIAPHLAWVEALPAFHLDQHRVFVHGGVDPAIPVERQEEKTLLWKRYPRDVATGHGSRHVVHGHDPDVDGPLRLSGRTALDTLAWRTGRLVVGVFDDTAAGGPIDVVEVTCQPALRHARINGLPDRVRGP